jgi:predicted nucleotidyltransferase
VLKWPDAQTIDREARRWAEAVGGVRKDVLRIGYFGSYSRGDWGVGSDLDVVIVLEGSESPFGRRGAEWDVTGLPVPAEVLVYTEEEWNSLNPRSLFGRVVIQETVWVYVRGS